MTIRDPWLANGSKDGIFVEPGTIFQYELRDIEGPSYQGYAESSRRKLMGLDPPSSATKPDQTREGTKTVEAERLKFEEQIPRRRMKTTLPSKEPLPPVRRRDKSFTLSCSRLLPLHSLS